MSSFEDALKELSILLRCPLCKSQLKTTVTLKECGHHFCEKCIYPILGTDCKCPTCSIPARVGNIIQNPSYDILVACTTKLFALSMSNTSDDEIPKPVHDKHLGSSSQVEESETPEGSPVWEYDCGPTFQHSFPLASELQTFPSLNTVLMDQDKEREQRQKDILNKETLEQDKEVEGIQPVPTISQLHRLLDIPKDANAISSDTQDNNVATQTLTCAEDLSGSDDETSGYVTPRMPSPTLDILKSLPMSHQPSLDTDDQGDTSRTRQSKRRRIGTETEYPEPLSNNESSENTASPETKRNNLRQARNLCEETGFTPEEQNLTRVVKSSQTLLDVTINGSSKTRDRKENTKHRKNTESTSTSSQRNSRRSHHMPLFNHKSETEIICCIFTGLSEEQREAFDENISGVVEAGLTMEHIQDEMSSDLTTHIITSADSNILKQDGVPLCPRVPKYLYGMLSKPWILRHEWFVDSIKARAWIPLPQLEYMIQGDTQFGPAPGTQKRREIRTIKSLKLFHSCKMFFYGDFGGVSITKEELHRLVREGGAETFQRRPSSKELSLTDNQGYFSVSRSHLYVTEEVKPWEVYIDRTAPIIVCDPASVSLTSESKKPNWLCYHQAVSLTWLLNCISCSIMGVEDINELYGQPLAGDNLDADEEINRLSEAWTQWRNKKSMP